MFLHICCKDEAVKYIPFNIVRYFSLSVHTAVANELFRGDSKMLPPGIADENFQ